MLLFAEIIQVDFNWLVEIEMEFGPGALGLETLDLEGNPNDPYPLNVEVKAIVSVIF